MLNAVRTCLVKYATFSGRARRPEFWWFFLAVLLAGLVARLVDRTLFAPKVMGTEPAARLNGTFEPFGWAVTLATFVPGLAVGWRRFHDFGEPGWKYLSPVLIVMGGMVGVWAISRLASADPAKIFVLELMTAGCALLAALYVLFRCLTPSDPGKNAYGPEPEP
jgi:uncharacterized membrane protein YhaH (DUF805 family)